LNKKILIAEIVLSLIASVAVLFYVTDPFGESWTELETERKERNASANVTPTPADSDPATPTPNADVTDPATPTPKEITPAGKPSPKMDNGNTFRRENGILLIEADIFGMTYSDLNRYFNGKLPATQGWEWSSVPLTYLDYIYSDGIKYTFYFESNRLVAVREEHEISSNAIPESLLVAAKKVFGEYRTYWYRAEEDRIIEYDWDCTVGSGTGEYAIFLNTYDNLYHVCQQYTSAAFTGISIQSR